jgi:hypothetical protein
MDNPGLTSPSTFEAIAYIIFTTPVIFFLYAEIAKRYALHGMLWQGTKALVALAALAILWIAILHVGEPGKERPFAYVFSALYVVVLGFVYVVADRYVRET